MCEATLEKRKEVLTIVVWSNLNEEHVHPFHHGGATMLTTACPVVGRRGGLGSSSRRGDEDPKEEDDDDDGDASGRPCGPSHCEVGSSFIGARFFVATPEEGPPPRRLRPPTGVVATARSTAVQPRPAAATRHEATT
eukprot:CAMPEP_0185709722 /NCGR_PEP_ID=MMETSP1164-20130828/29257_1 /TAXON_ID=1104430 /ORGANISM="Chrysoreinhardia sp, Strain CCMP2950" /LENGTH=136 /DNA_ID=CAMNT_0028377219 /DNA_START=94 /DNA_END=501 /DNA_ORIENTATION=-